MRFGISTLACLAAGLLPAQTPPGIAISVHVINSVTRSPIAGANVVLNSAQGSTADGTTWGHTDAAGVFEGQVSSAGSHLLTVTRHGYRAIGTGLGKMVDVNTRSGNDATIQMLPLGVITGRVLDQYGDPVRHAVVRTEDRTTAPGQPTSYESYWSAITDDRGDYRIADVEPGQHYLAVEFNSVGAERDSGIRSTSRWPLTGGFILYPDATSVEEARQIDVAAGETLRVGDLRLQIQRAVTISGRIQPSGGANQMLSLRRDDGLALHYSPTVQAIGIEPDGGFRTEALPGKYTLNGSDNRTGKESKPLAVDVRDKDVAGLELSMTSGYELRGRIAVDGQEQIDFSKLLLNFGGAQVKIDPGGVFQTVLPGGKGRYTLQGLSDDWFISSVLVGGKQIDGKQVSIEPGSSDMILTLSPHGARVSIHSQGPGSETVALVALLRDGGESADPESIPGAQADGSGVFTVRSVPPGAYRVFTLDAASYLLIMRPDLLLEKYRKLTPLINVTEGERKEVNLPVLKIQAE